MVKNRRNPYGYQIEGGKTVIEPQEAEIIRKVYRKYAEGLSYLAIATALTESGVRYMPDKPIWNKNMVARILQNKNYLGTDKYPAILTIAEHRSAELAQKPYTHTESQDIKALKPLLVCAVCGNPVRRRLKTDGAERWYCPTDTTHVTTALTDELLLQSIEALQNQLSSIKLMGTKTAESKQIDLGVIRLQNEIEQTLAQPEPDPAAIQQTIMTLAAQKYANTHDTGDGGAYLTETILRLADQPLDSALLKSITAEIKIKHTQAIALVLKNGQSVAAGKGTKHG